MIPRSTHLTQAVASRCACSRCNRCGTLLFEPSKAIPIRIRPVTASSYPSFSCQSVTAEVCSNITALFALATYSGLSAWSRQSIPSYVLVLSTSSGPSLDRLYCRSLLLFKPLACPWHLEGRFIGSQFTSSRHTIYCQACPCVGDTGKTLLTPTNRSSFYMYYI